LNRFLQETQDAEGADLEAAEFWLRSRMQVVSGKILLGLSKLAENGYKGSSLPCSCGQRARFVEYRKKPLGTVVGRILLERAYYHCKDCHRGHIPLDEEWDIVATEYSPGLRRLMGRVGANGSFERGHDDLHELAGVEVGTKQIERVSEAIGAEIRSGEIVFQHQIYEGRVSLPSIQRPPGTVYIAVDGTGVPVVPKEVKGRKGKQEDGKARTREARLGCLFTQTVTDSRGRPIRDDASTTYVGVIEDAKEFGKEVYAEVQRRGLSNAERTVVLGDGAAWIWEMANEHFPGAVQILDLYHAREHLWKIARILYDQHEKKRHQWAKRRISELDQGKVSSIVKAIKWALPHNPAVADSLRTEAEFFRKNRQRMQYSLFRKLGVFVGSGVVEAGCKTVIGSRAKQSGMHWTVNGANAIITLRRCLLNGEWENYWAARTNR